MLIRKMLRGVARILLMVFATSNKAGEISITDRRIKGRKLELKRGTNKGVIEPRT